MKIRTIFGVLLVLALVLGSTGIAVADCPNPDCPNPDCPNPDCPNPDCIPNEYDHKYLERGPHRGR